jgi:predicted MFS family arabinose efflux permease
VVLAGISVLTAAAAALGPDRFAPLAKPEGGHAKLGLRPLAGLLAAFLFLAFIVALWVYLEPLAALSGLTPQQAGLAVAVALGMQVLGGAAATAVGRRWRPTAAVIAVAGVNAAILAVLWSGPGPALFMGAVALFGFLWLFALPFQTLLLIQADPTRRAAMQLGTAQLLGSSFGPLAASMVVADGDVRRAIALSAVLLFAAVGLISLLAASGRSPAAPAGDSRG